MVEYGSGSPWKRFWNRGGWWKAFLVAAVYLGVFNLLSFAVGRAFSGQIDVAHLFSSGRSLFLAVALPVLLGGVVAVGFAWSLGWQRDLFARQPLRGRGWMWIAVAVVLLPILLHAAAINWSAYPGSVLLAAVALGVGVGFTEEILTRGIAVELLRRAGYSERVVALLSSLVFALLHLSNIFSGQPVLTVLLTIVYAFGFGMFMYLVLRVTRRLIWPMVLHGLTDPTTTLATGGIDTHGASTGSAGLISIAGLFNFVFPVLGLLALVLIRGRSTAQVSPADDPSASDVHR